MFLKKIMLISLLAFFYIISSAADAFEKGLLWQIESPAGAKSKIFGTNHLVDNDTDLIFKIITKEIRSAKTVFIEYLLDEKDHPFIYKNLINTNTLVQNRLSKNEFSHLKKFISEQNINFDILKNASPFLIYSYLINPGSMRNLQMDFKIADYAKECDKTVKALEDSHTVLKIFLGFDDDFYIFLVKDWLHNSELLPSYREHLKALYLSQNLNNIINSLYEKKISSSTNKKYFNAVINERNLNMLTSMRTELDKGSAFIAVGAAHLGGDQGLLNLLKNEGYKITNLELNLVTKSSEYDSKEDENTSKSSTIL